MQHAVVMRLPLHALSCVHPLLVLSACAAFLPVRRQRPASPCKALRSLRWPCSTCRTLRMGVTMGVATPCCSALIQTTPLACP